MIHVIIKNLSVPNTVGRDQAPIIGAGDFDAVPDKGEPLWVKNTNVDEQRWMVVDREWTYWLPWGAVSPQTSLTLYVMDENSYQLKLLREAAVAGR